MKRTLPSKWWRTRGRNWHSKRSDQSSLRRAASGHSRAGKSRTPRCQTRLKCLFERQRKTHRHKRKPWVKATSKASKKQLSAVTDSAKKAADKVADGTTSELAALVSAYVKASNTATSAHAKVVKAEKQAAATSSGSCK